MIDVADSNAVYYYHFDGLGSVVALSDSNGDSCQSYEYSVYGQVAAEDPNFLTNPYMFTGRRFDIETGPPDTRRVNLYYYRARCYNPHIGRFMQTDPVGYDDGINWYLYCKNNPGRVDPSGLSCWEDFWDSLDDFLDDAKDNWENLDLDDSNDVAEFWENFWDDYNQLLDDLKDCEDEVLVKDSNDRKRKYHFKGDPGHMKLFCHVLGFIVDFPGLIVIGSGKAVRGGIEKIWCRVMEKDCTEYCLFDKEIPLNERDECESKCSAEGDACVERSKSGKCQFEFEISG